MDKIYSPVRLEDHVIGEIMINSDGTFEGHFNDEWTYRRIVDLFQLGYADGMSITPNLVPAQSARV